MLIKALVDTVLGETIRNAISRYKDLAQEGLVNTDTNGVLRST